MAFGTLKYSRRNRIIKVLMYHVLPRAAVPSSIFFIRALGAQGHGPRRFANYVPKGQNMYPWARLCVRKCVPMRPGSVPMDPDLVCLRTQLMDRISDERGNELTKGKGGDEGSGEMEMEWTTEALKHWKKATTWLYPHSITLNY
ncbi:hypothetical protein EVAR_9889_1 [Eumeta japonica]|uniref:Uncharacterized protein n=1 Tax=Eumeta variegata TaxID=151549 RepID=A0A4C1TQA9_EUMVA|nr:hypothetical protein EVAR_9889_1 [Eumeta japonica]